MLRVFFRIGLIALFLFFILGLVAIWMDGCAKPADKPSASESSQMRAIPFTGLRC